MTMEEQLNRIAAKITLCIELTDRERALWPDIWSRSKRAIGLNESWTVTSRNTRKGITDNHRRT